jgi:hypothetical protein
MTKVRAGRPTTVDAKRVNVMLDAETIEVARKMGDGNLSAGIRLAVKAQDSQPPGNSATIHQFPVLKPLKARELLFRLAQEDMDNVFVITKEPEGYFSVWHSGIGPLDVLKAIEMIRVGILDEELMGDEEPAE